MGRVEILPHDDSEYAPSGRTQRIDRLKAPLISGRRFFFLALLLAFLLSCGSLYRRLSTEWSHRSVAILVEYRDIIALASQEGISPEEAASEMKARGVLGLTVSEFSGRDLASGMLPMAFSTLGAVDPLDRVGVEAPLNCAVMTLDSSDPLLPQIMDHLRTRLPGVHKYVPGKKTLIILPLYFAETLESAILPDLAALEFAQKNGLYAVIRPAPAQYQDSESIAASIEWLKKKYPCVRSVLPAGSVVAGYPDLDPIVEKLGELDLTAAQAEFVRQIGASSLMARMAPSIIPLHSLVRDEVISRRLTRNQINDRMIRSVHERSIRLLLMRPYDLYTGNRYGYFIDDLDVISDGLRSRGYSFAWPKTFERSGTSPLAAIALAVMFLTTASSYARRNSGNNKNYVSKIDLYIFAAVSGALALILWKLPFAARIFGGLAAAIAAAEAALWALDRYERPSDGLIMGLLIVMGCGLIIAAFYGTTDAMLRLAPFSGVTLTVVLPPLLVLANDVRQGVHPGSVLSLIKRPPLWGELLLLGCFLAAGLVVVIRSGNSGYVSDWEMNIRETLERVLWVRPRTKEFLIGYPCLIIYYSLARGGRAANFREVFRIGASLAYSSAINTFCHFHTLLPLTVIRVVNGWWLGILLGFVMLVVVYYIADPLIKKGSARAASG